MIFFGFGASHVLIAITFAYFLATSISWEKDVLALCPRYFDDVLQVL